MKIPLEYQMVTKTYLKPTHLLTYVCERSASSESSDSSDVSDSSDSSQSSERNDTSDQKVLFHQQKNLFFSQKKYFNKHFLLQNKIVVKKTIFSFLFFVLFCIKKIFIHFSGQRFATLAIFFVFKSKSIYFSRHSFWPS